MKIQIDTKKKTIKLAEDIGLKELEKVMHTLIEGLSAMDEDWKKYKVESNTIIYEWANPIYVGPYITPRTNVPDTPWYEPYRVICADSPHSTMINLVI